LGSNVFAGVGATEYDRRPESWASYSPDRFTLPIIGAVSRDGNTSRNCDRRLGINCQPGTTACTTTRGGFLRRVAAAESGEYMFM